MRSPLTLRLPRRRSVLKAVYLAMIPLFAWFTLVHPREVSRWAPDRAAFCSDMGLAFVSLALIRWALYMRHDRASGPGPKLRGWARRLHSLSHKTLF